MPTGGGESAIGDGAALMGADLRIEIRKAIVAKLVEDWTEESVQDWFAIDGMACNLRDAAVKIAVERESRAREVRDEALGKAQAENERMRDQLQEFVTASLAFDYTANDECPEYADDAEELAAALANITEMHRVLNVRQERLFAAHDRIDKALERIAADDADFEDGVDTDPADAFKDIRSALAGDTPEATDG